MRMIRAAADGQKPHVGQHSRQQHRGAPTTRRHAAYSPAVPRKPSDVQKVEQDRETMTSDGALLEPLQQLLDDPLGWPLQTPTTDSTVPPATEPSGPVLRNLFRLPHVRQAAAGSGPVPPSSSNTPQLPDAAPSQHGAAHVHAAKAAGHAGGHKHPPIAPEDPAELLKVLEIMDPPRRRLVIFKGGGYVYADMEALIQSAGLGHVMRLTNLVRKAHCIIAKEKRDTGKRVNLEEHRAAARNAHIPFLLIERLEPEQLLLLVRPLLIRKRIVAQHPQAGSRAEGAGAADAAGDS